MAFPTINAKSSSKRSVPRGSKSAGATRQRPDGREPLREDGPDLEELRRSRMEYYSAGLDDQPPTTSNSVSKERERKTSRSKQATVRTREDGTSRRREKTSVRKQRRDASEKIDEEDGYVYKRAPSARLSNPIIPDVFENEGTKDELEDDDTSSILSKESLSKGLPPPAPDPPGSAPLTPTKISGSSVTRSTRTRRKRSGSRSVAKPTRALKEPKPLRNIKVKRRVSEPPLPTVTENREPLLSSSKEKRRVSVFGGIFTSRPKEKVKDLPSTVECLTCASKKSPSRAAVLECGHIMCHSCLKHIFTMSVTDPQHMPPRCCTSDHIPLKHVARLFDDRFKIRWNKKYLEYTTRNRLYCPARGCGAWIPPQHVKSSSTDNKRLIGTCPRCKTRTCASCGRKWHKSADCNSGTKDVDGREFAKMAAASGWQRCYNCTAMVELKEGCNHMTCRCGEQFCMVCGVKWKGCDCPWFNHHLVSEDDRFILGAERLVQPAQRGNLAGRGYAEEMAYRHDQERRDEEMARRMQGLELDGLDYGRDGSRTPTMERDWGGNDTFGFGNMAGHFLNDNFVQRAARILTNAFTEENRAAAERLVAEIRGDRAPPLPGSAVVDPYWPQWTPPPAQEQGIRERDDEQPNIPSRRPSQLDQDPRDRFNTSDMPDEVNSPVVSRRRTHKKRSRAGPTHDEGRRSSVLAGLATGPGQGRVEQWVQHIDDATPEE